MSGIPCVDISSDAVEAATALDGACRDAGFFYVVGHGIDPGLKERLGELAHQFFGLPEVRKAEIAMAQGGRAWRGWFPLRGELTRGVPDEKEGLYFGAELSPDHPRVHAKTPLHGSNLFPSEPQGMRQAVLEYMEAMTALAQRVLSVMAIALGLGADWFVENLTSDPLVLFRIFRYPPVGSEIGPNTWSVAEHTDYGLLTILGQDPVGGLQVRRHREWIDVPPLGGAFVCNLGDMLERMTGGIYRSTPHRVLNSSSSDDRLSFPFFLDPGWDTAVEPLPLEVAPGVEDSHARWDGRSVFDFCGTYGDYITAKVSKVFPALVEGLGDELP